MVWFLVALLVVSFLVSVFLAPKPQLENARAGKFETSRLPKAAEGDPPAMVLGTVRLRGPNTLWFGDVRVEPIKEKVKTGLFSSKKVIVGYKYYIGIDLGLCLGFGVVLKKIWAGKYTLWSGTNSGGSGTINKEGLFGGEKQRGGMAGTFNFYPGNATQSVNNYVQSKIGRPIPAYNGVSHIVFQNFYVGTQPQLEPLNFELQRLTNGLGLSSNQHYIGSDLNPVEAMYQIMVAGYGGMKLDPGLIDTTSWIAAAETCYAEGNGFSFLIDRANSSKEVLEEILRQIDGVMYQDPTTGKIVLKLVRFDYDPNDLPVFNENNIVEILDWTKGSWSETFNQVRVHYTKRGKGYVEGVAVAQDMGNINWAGRVRGTEISFPGVYENTLANSLAARELSFLNVPFFRCRLILNRQAARLRPGDPFILSWREYGIDSMVMRVQKFDLGELTNGRIVADVVQDKFSAATKYLEPDNGDWVPVDRTPQVVTSYRIIEAPPHYLFLSGVLSTLETGVVGRALITAKAPGVYSLAYYCYQSDLVGFDPYYDILNEVPYTANCQLVNTWNGGTSSGLATNLLVYNVSDASEFATITDDDIKAGGGLWLIEDEIVGVRSAINNGNGTWTLTVRRGLMDTKIVSHAADTVMWRLDGINPLGIVDLSTPTFTTTDRYVRLGDSTGDSVAMPSELTNITMPTRNRAARPAPPDYVTINAVREPTSVAGPNLTVAWRNRDRTAIRFIDDATDSLTPGVETVVRWRINAGAWTTVVSTGTSLVVTPGATGTFDIEVYSRVIATPACESWIRETHTCTVT